MILSTNTVTDKHILSKSNPRANMKFVFISDTHNRHSRLELPAGDVIVHCGDHGSKGSLTEANTFLQWFAGLTQYKHRIMIAGNHDIAWEKLHANVLEIDAKYNNIIYLRDSAWISPCGITVWGSPVCKKFGRWAFMKEGLDLKQHWEQIPDGLDLLITHGPPAEILDLNNQGESCGDKELAERIPLVNPRFHVFGHIHESYGYLKKTTEYYNVSCWDHRNDSMNKPVVIEI